MKPSADRKKVEVYLVRRSEWYSKSKKVIRNEYKNV